ncbi:hypothetical protein [Methylomagnum sp.]
MNLLSKTTIIAASVILSFGTAQAKPDCKKIMVQKKVNATIGLNYGCVGLEQLTGGSIPEFQNYLPHLSGVCYTSNGKIPAKIGGKDVEFETISAFLANPTPTSQLVITLFNVYSGENPIGRLYALDNIHLQEGYEDEVFIGGSEQFQDAGGSGRLSYTILDNGWTISFNRLKGEVCVGSE